MTFDAVLTQVLELLKRQGPSPLVLSKRRFELDDDYLKDLRDEILYVYPVREDEGRGLVWTGNVERTREAAPPPAQLTQQALSPAWLGTGAARTSAERDRADLPRLDRLSCQRHSGRTTVSSGASRRSAWNHIFPSCEAGAHRPGRYAKGDPFFVSKPRKKYLPFLISTTAASVSPSSRAMSVFSY